MSKLERREGLLKEKIEELRAISEEREASTDQKLEAVANGCIEKLLDIDIFNAPDSLIVRNFVAWKNAHDRINALRKELQTSGEREDKLKSEIGELRKRVADLIERGNKDVLR